MKKTVFLLSLLLFCLNIAFTQNKCTNKLVYVSNQTISEVCFERDRFVKYVDKQTDVVEKFLMSKNTGREIILQCIIKTDTTPQILFSSRPALTEDEYQYLQSELNKIKALKSKVVEFIYMLEFQYKSETIHSETTFAPEISNPVLRAEKEFFMADMSAAIQLLQKYTLTEVLPVFSAFLKSQDRKYIGAVSLGTRIDKALKNNTIDLDSLCDYNIYYWKALIEMQAGNNLVFATKVFLLIANSDFEKAMRLSSVLDLFKKNNSISDLYLDELYRLLIISDKIQDNISLLNIYKSNKESDSVLLLLTEMQKAIPKSADLNNWLYHYYLEKQEDEQFNLYKRAVNQNDPLHFMKTEVFSAKDNYLMELRNEADSLFKNPQNLHRDFMRYADIALIVGDYSFAAHLYWLAITHFSNAEAGRDNLTAYFMYCLKKIGMDNLIMYFDFNQNTEFSRVDTELKALQDNHPAYKNFNPDDEVK